MAARSRGGDDRRGRAARGAGGPAMTSSPPSAATTEFATEFETVIGLEVHCQLATQRKMFSPTAAVYADAEPNTVVDPVSLGLPGTLPVINRTAVAWTIKTALALHMTIPRQAKFDRKNYHYPDLMKGYQISQFDMPLSQGGTLEIEVNGVRRRVLVNRVHLEEDASSTASTPPASPTRWWTSTAAARR